VGEVRHKILRRDGMVEDSRLKEEKHSVIFSREEWNLLESTFLSGSPVPAGEPSVKRLSACGAVDERGTVTPAWQKALRALSSSPFEILLISGAFEHFAVARYYSDPHDEGSSFVSVVADRDGSIHFSFPWRIGDIAGLLHGLLDMYGPSADIPLKFSLDYDEFSAIMGLVDAIKAQTIESLQQRSPFMAKPVKCDELAATIGKGLASSDFRWWVTVSQTLSPSPLTADSGKLGGALQRLSEKSLVCMRDGGYLPSDTGGALISSLLSPLSSATLSFVGRREGGALTVDFVTAVRTATVFWVFNFSDFSGETGKVSIVSSFSMNFFAYVNELYEKYREMFGKPLVPAGPETAAAGNLRKCSQCGEAISETAKFCPGCAAPLSSAEIQGRESVQCPSCGKESEKGARFCSNCGTPAEQNDKAPSLSKSCPGCGAVLDSAANFCPGCGKKLAGLPQKVEEKPLCIKCGADLAPDARFCRRCGTKRQ